MKDQRIYGLDALRAVLMFLGIFIHAALNYMPEWYTQDPQHLVTWSYAYIIDPIHVFRMPAFFVISGFFGALLVEKRGFYFLLKHRFKRIFLPFLVFSCLNSPFLHLLSTHNRYICDGELNPWTRTFDELALHHFIPFDFAHLWFLYHLLWITLGTVASAKILQKIDHPLFETIKNWGIKIITQPLLYLVVLGTINALWCVVFTWGEIPTDSSWFPNPIIIFYYTAFFGGGWFVYNSKIDLQIFTKYFWWMITLAIVCMGSRLFTGPILEGYDPISNHEPPIEIILGFFLHVMSGSLALFGATRGLIGFFLHFANNKSMFWRYGSDSSYFVYIIHIGVTTCFTSLLIGLNTLTIIKFLLVVIFTGIYSLLFYDAFVRSTFVGAFLNGRKYNRLAGTYTIPATIMTTFLIGYSSYSLPFLSEPLSPWKQGKSPIELMNDTPLEYPYKSINIRHKEQLASCVKIQELIICPTQVNLFEAKEICTSQNAKLISFETQEEHERISSLIWKLIEKPMWMDLSDTKDEGNFVWGNGVTLKISHWSDGEPNDWGNDEDCATFNWHGKNSWNDQHCNTKSGFVCEID